MFCDRIQTDLSRMLDGEPTRLDRPSLLRHLDRCEACRDFMGLTKQIEESYRSRVQGGIDALRRLEGDPPRRRIPLLAPALLAAAILMVAAGVMLAMRAGGPANAPYAAVVSGTRTPARQPVALFPRGFGWEEPRFAPVEEEPLPMLAHAGPARELARRGVPRSLGEGWDELEPGRDPLRLLFARESSATDLLLPRLVD